MTDHITSQIIEIETKLAFQEQTIEQLNEVVIQQQGLIEALQRQLKMINHKIEQESHHWENEHSLSDEKPPHY